MLVAGNGLILREKAHGWCWYIFGDWRILYTGSKEILGWLRRALWLFKLIAMVYRYTQRSAGSMGKHHTRQKQQREREGERGSGVSDVHSAAGVYERPHGEATRSIQAPAGPRSAYAGSKHWKYQKSQNFSSTISSVKKKPLQLRKKNDIFHCTRKSRRNWVTTKSISREWDFHRSRKSSKTVKWPPTKAEAVMRENMTEKNCLIRVPELREEKSGMPGTVLWGLSQARTRWARFKVLLRRWSRRGMRKEFKKLREKVLPRFRFARENPSRKSLERER